MKRVLAYIRVAESEEIEDWTDTGEDDYRGSHTAPDRDSGAPIHDLTVVYPDDVYSPQAIQYYGTGDRKLDRATFALVWVYEGHPDKSVAIYRSIPSDVPKGQAVIQPGDWVTINKNYAVAHGESTLLGAYQIIQKQVTAKDIYTCGDSIHEWGYDPA